jgi:hypothetical protein
MFVVSAGFHKNNEQDVFKALSVAPFVLSFLESK